MQFQNVFRVRLHPDLTRNFTGTEQFPCHSRKEEEIKNILSYGKIENNERSNEASPSTLLLSIFGESQSVRAAVLRMLLVAPCAVRARPSDHLLQFFRRLVHCVMFVA